MIAILVSVATSNASSKTCRNNPYILLVQGRFLGEKNVQYTIYKMNKKGVFVNEIRTKGRKFYNIECQRGCKYIIRFQSKKGDVKFLMVDATNSGYFGVNVDFTKPYDAKITYTKNGYSLIHLTDSNIKTNLLVSK